MNTVAGRARCGISLAALGFCGYYARSGSTGADPQRIHAADEEDEAEVISRGQNGEPFQGGKPTQDAGSLWGTWVPRKGVSLKRSFADTFNTEGYVRMLGIILYSVRYAYDGVTFDEVPGIGTKQASST